MLASPSPQTFSGLQTAKIPRPAPTLSLPLSAPLGLPVSKASPTTGTYAPETDDEDALGTVGPATQHTPKFAPAPAPAPTVPTAAAPTVPTATGTPVGVLPNPTAPASQSTAPVYLPGGVQPIPYNEVYPIPGVGTPPTPIPGPGTTPIPPGVGNPAGTPASPPPVGAGTLEDELWRRLQEQWANGGTGTQIDPQIQAAILQSLANPSRYDSDMAQATYDRLNRTVQDQQDADLRALNLDASRRGVGQSTFYTTDRADLAERFGQQRTDLAQRVLESQANTYAADRDQALARALGWSSTGWDRQRQALSDILGYGQQQFDNQVTTEQINNGLTEEQLQQLLALLGGTGG